MNDKYEERIWYGRFGGCFVADAFSSACDDYYKDYRNVVKSQKFWDEFYELESQCCSTTIELCETDDNLRKYLCSENYYSILGTSLLAKHLGKEKAVCGVRYVDEALVCARICKAIGLPLKLYLSADISNISTLRTELNLLGAETNDKMCKELFNLPEMYAFQDWIAAPANISIVNCRCNAGAYPQSNIAMDFAKIYGEKLTAILSKEDKIQRTIIPCVSGSFAMGVIAPLASTGMAIDTVECDPIDGLSKELDSYCGTFTVVMRDCCNDRILAPALAELHESGRVGRVIVPFKDIAETSAMPDSADNWSLQSRASVLYAESKNYGKETALLLRAVRWGSSL